MNYGKQHTDGSRSGGQPVTEPVWIEHDGSAVCPVPAGHDVEVRFSHAEVVRNQEPKEWLWRRITHYRDWTAFKQQEAMGEDVPKWAMRKALQLGEDYPNEGWVNTFARYIAAHEQPPVDWLREVVSISLRLHCPIDGRWPTSMIDDLTAELRNRIPNIDSLANAAGGGGK